MERKKTAKKAKVKGIRLTAVILTIIFVALILIYQFIASHRNLNDDFAVIFSTPKK